MIGKGTNSNAMVARSVRNSVLFVLVVMGCGCQRPSAELSWTKRIECNQVLQRFDLIYPYPMSEDGHRQARRVCHYNASKNACYILESSNSYAPITSTTLYDGLEGQLLADVTQSRETMRDSWCILDPAYGSASEASLEQRCKAARRVIEEAVESKHVFPK